MHQAIVVTLLLQIKSLLTNLHLKLICFTEVGEMPSIALMAIALRKDLIFQHTNLNHLPVNSDLVLEVSVEPH